MKSSYAIIETSGKQFRVAAGDRVKVDYIGAGEGSQVELSRVLFINDGKDSIVGNPVIENASVKATCVGEGKGKKIIVFKYKPKVRYRVKKGHRQQYTMLEINDIVKPGAKAAGKSSKKEEEASAGGND
jgi:large subunit ribosomal protein L21